MLNIHIVTDGGQMMGMGHVQQSMTLARKLEPHAHIVFLTKSDGVVVDFIREGGFFASAHADDDAIFATLYQSRPDVILFDKIDVSVDLVKRIKRSMNSKVVIFTNLTSANGYADMVVLPRAPELSTGITARFQNIATVDEVMGRKCFYGPKYWVLRPEFLSYKKLGIREAVPIKKLLLAFGGSDPSNLTSRAVQALVNHGNRYEVDIILGRHFSYEDMLRSILDRDTQKLLTVTLHRNVRNVAELMYQADLAVTAAGMSMFEALCVGTPVIVIPQDQLQRDTYGGVMRLLEVEDIDQLPQLIRGLDFTRPSDQMIKNMMIGEGVEALVDAIIC